MFYLKSITTKNSFFTESVKTEVFKITTGELSHVVIFFPFGCQNLVRCKVFLNDIQIIPYNRDEFLVGDNLFLKIDLGIEIDDIANTIKIYQENLDDTFTHTILYMFNVIRKDTLNFNALQSLIKVE